MDKKSIFITVSVLIFLFISFRVVYAIVNSTLEDGERRGVQLYASTIKYAFTEYTYRNGFSTYSVDDLNVETSTRVECEEKILYVSGDVELHGCTVENSKKKYKYVNGKVERE